MGRADPEHPYLPPHPSISGPPASFRAAITELSAEIGAALDGAQAWQTFERQFQQVHAGYLEQLAARFPALTPTELKVCALVKINLSTKEIAQILNTEPRSIEKYRQRIRSKLGLAQEESLGSFLIGVTGSEKPGVEK